MKRISISPPVAALIDFALEAWVCTDARAALQERIVCLTGSGGSVQVCINGGHFVVDNSGGPATGIADSRSRNDGVWHQVVLSRREQTTYSLHLDGALIDQHRTRHGLPLREVGRPLPPQNPYSSAPLRRCCLPPG